jgi:hypothetical protein
MGTYLWHVSGSPSSSSVAGQTHLALAREQLEQALGLSMCKGLDISAS